MNLREDINRIKQVMGINEASYDEMAVIEITKPLSYMNQDYYYQIVPYSKTKLNKIYINKGSSGHKTISTDNIKVLKVFKSDEKDEMNKYLKSLREKKKEEYEGSEVYAAPAFEMKPDHIHFKHLYNEEKVPIKLKRRAIYIKKLLDITFDNMHPCDFENLDHFTKGVIYEIETTLLAIDLFDDYNITREEVIEFIEKYFNEDITMFYINSQEDC